MLTIISNREAFWSALRLAGFGILVVNVLQLVCRMILGAAALAAHEDSKFAYFAVKGVGEFTFDSAKFLLPLLSYLFAARFLRTARWEFHVVAGVFSLTLTTQLYIHESIQGFDGSWSEAFGPFRTAAVPGSIIVGATAGWILGLIINRFSTKRPESSALETINLILGAAGFAAAYWFIITSVTPLDLFGGHGATELALKQLLGAIVGAALFVGFSNAIHRDVPPAQNVTMMFLISSLIGFLFLLDEGKIRDQYYGPWWHSYWFVLKHCVIASVLVAGAISATNGLIRMFDATKTLSR